MTAFKIMPGRLQRDLLIASADRMAGHIKLTIPEFSGTAEGQAFVINQVLHWEHASENGHAEFSLDCLPAEVGIDHHGSLTARERDALDLEAYVANAMPSPIEEAHHTVHLDLSTIESLEDPEGLRSFVYTNTGWVSLAELLKPVEPAPASVWVGATYGERTIIWRVIARTSQDGRLTVGFAIERGYALASDHPDWPKGLLAGCRWGTLSTDEEQLVRGRIYFCSNGLEELRARYARDFRPSS